MTSATRPSRIRLPRLSRRELALLLAAVVLYLPGIGWGVPNDPTSRLQPWGADELGHISTSQLGVAVFGRPGRVNPQYPLFGYVLQSAIAGPFVFVARQLGEPGATTESRILVVRVILARLVSLLLAALLVIVAMRTFSVLWGATDAWIAGLLTLLLFPLFYYSRTSNVDVPALFFSALALWQFAGILRNGLDRRKAVFLGVAAALAVATKDASYGAMLPVAVIVTWRHWRTQSFELLLAGAVALIVFAVASGAAVNFTWYSQHLEFIRHGSNRHFGFYYGSTKPYLQVLGETSRQIVVSLSLPGLGMALAGIAIAVVQDRRGALWLLPPLGVVAFTILPVRYVLLRFVLILSYGLLFFAAFALSRLRDHRPVLAGVLIALLSGWCLLRGADLTWQMLRDSRYAAAEWLDDNLRAGDRLGHYRGPQKLPFVKTAVTYVEGPLQLPARDAPELIVVIPWEAYDGDHEYVLPVETYAELRAGRSGYQQILGLKTPALFPTRPGMWVNPEVKVFVRDDRVASLADPTPRIQTER